MTDRDESLSSSGAYRPTPRPGTSSNVPATLVPVLPEQGAATQSAPSPAVSQSGSHAHEISVAELPDQSGVQQAAPGKSSDYGTVMASAITEVAPELAEVEAPTDVAYRQEPWFESGSNMDQTLELEDRETSFSRSRSSSEDRPVRSSASRSATHSQSAGLAASAASSQTDSHFRTRIPSASISRSASASVAGALSLPSGQRSGAARAVPRSGSYGHTPISPTRNQPAASKRRAAPLVLAGVVAVAVIAAAVVLLSGANRRPAIVDGEMTFRVGAQRYSLPVAWGAELSSQAPIGQTGEWTGVFLHPNRAERDGVFFQEFTATVESRTVLEETLTSGGVLEFREGLRDAPEGGRIAELTGELTLGGNTVVVHCMRFGESMRVSDARWCLRTLGKLIPSGFQP